MKPLESTYQEETDFLVSPLRSAGILWENAYRHCQEYFRSPFWIRLRSWEYWPFAVFYFPVAFYWIWLTIKSRSFFWFTSSNPGIEFGGMLGESKFELYKKMDKTIQPTTIKCEKDCDPSKVLKAASGAGLKFPMIAKPDIGERGWGVSKLNSERDLVSYMQNNRVDFLLQELINYPVELGVFYYRYPGEERGTISSIVKKGFLSVTGDGKKTLEELIKCHDRALLQFESLREKLGEKIYGVPAKGEVIVLEEIGNHCLGTTFLDANELIDPELTKVFDDISKEVEGFYFGRYDLRCASVEALKKGEQFKIIELNGAGGEPGHIYQPGASIWAAYRSILHHLKVLYEISRINHKRGKRRMGFAKGYKFWQGIRRYNKLKSAV